MYKFLKCVNYEFVSVYEIKAMNFFKARGFENMQNVDEVCKVFMLSFN